ncbi:plasmid mobilization protein [Burkholderia alba]|uniref:plasmid mobilization protein n=1 Tax=Burkholderia alba TaxID=2683677 RepID=UPI003899160A
MSANDLDPLIRDKRPGRPKSTRPLSKPISTRLDDAQMEVFADKVRASGMTPSEFLRDCVLTNRTQIVARPPASVERKRIMFVVNKAGNNINQLAHIANSQKVAGKLSEATLVAILDELELVTQLLKAHLHRVD